MNVGYCLNRAKQFHGNHVAINQEGEQLTYHQLHEQVQRSARKLAATGVRKGDRLAVLMLNSPAYFDLYFSIPQTGALIVPLNTRWHRTELIQTLADSGSESLFVDGRFASSAQELREAVPQLKRVFFYARGTCPEGLTDFASVEPGQVSFVEPHEDDLVGLFYTSGTTGGPKGAMLSHRNLYSNAVHALLPPAFLPEHCSFLHAAPMFHLADVGAILGLTLMGASHSFLPTFDPEGTLQAIERYRITNTILVPAMINMVLNHHSFDHFDLSSLRRIAYGASPMPLPLLRLAKEKLGCDFAQGYGMTEVSPLLTTLAPEHHQFENADRAFAPIKSAGKPVLGVDVRVVDNEDRDVPTGEVGEIIARGPNVMKGYWKRPEISAEVLRGGWMHTGDLGAFDEEGFLYILDRKKDMIKSGGENVYSPEVESILCAHPAVLEAAVIGVPHQKWDETIRAVVAVRNGASVTEQELISWCRERLTTFKCPTSVVFTDSLPKGGTGKVQKNVLRELYGGVCASPRSPAAYS
jgi:long-chain acyl-CoA synthetase